MGFNLPEKSIQAGTSGHRSALKMKAASPAKDTKIPGGLDQESDATHKKTVPHNKKGEHEWKSPTEMRSPAKEDIAWGGTKTWSQGQKDSGDTLNKITIDQRDYEKKMKAKDPSWNKREDNKWKTTQNKINKHLGSKKVYDTIADKKTVTVNDKEVMKGIQRKGGKTLTEKEKQAETTKLGIVQDQIDKAKKDKDRDARDKGQQEKGRIKGGGDDKYTGTVVSRTLGKIKESANKGQLKRRSTKRKKLEEKYKRRTDKGKSTKRLEKRYERKGGDAEDLTTSPAKHYTGVHKGAGDHPAHKLEDFMPHKVFGKVIDHVTGKSTKKASKRTLSTAQTKALGSIVGKKTGSEVGKKIGTKVSKKIGTKVKKEKDRIIARDQYERELKLHQKSSKDLATIDAERKKAEAKKTKEKERIVPRTPTAEDKAKAKERQKKFKRKI